MKLGKGKVARNTGRTPAERRAYWMNQLSPSDQEHIAKLERSVATHHQLIAAYTAEMRAQISKLMKERQRLINRGTGRARYAVVGRKEYLDVNPGAAKRPRRKELETQ